MTARVALITGCGKRVGIGASTARALSASGVVTVVSDIRSEGIANSGGGSASLPDRSWQGLDSLVEEISSAGGTAMAVRGDVSAERDAARMVAQVVEKYGRLDILVNNAGAPHGEDRNEIEAVPLSAWEKVLAVNVTGVFLMSRSPNSRCRSDAIAIFMLKLFTYQIPILLELRPEQCAPISATCLPVRMVPSIFIQKWYPTASRFGLNANLYVSFRLNPRAICHESQSSI